MQIPSLSRSRRRPANGSPASTWRPATAWSRCTAGATWSSPTSARACRGPRAPLPDQPLRADVRRDHRVDPGQGRPATCNKLDRFALPRQPGRLRDPQRRARGAARRPACCTPTPAPASRSARRRAACCCRSAAVDLRAGLAGLPRLRGRRRARRREPRLQADLGDATFLMLRNHGLLTVGTTVADAFLSMYPSRHLPDPDLGAGRQPAARSLGDGAGRRRRNRADHGSQRC